MDMAIKAAGETHPGRVRQNNEDAFFPSRANGAIDTAGAARNGQLFIVADGVGGSRGGARASEIAVSRLPFFFYGATNGDTARTLRQAMDSTAHEIVSEAASHPDRANMSCTIVAAVVKDGQATIAHMGDARAYLLRGGVLRQLTRDDTWVQMQVDKGTLTPAEAAAHAERNVITKSLGNPSFPEPTVSQLPLQPGDRLLLCSDGLSGVATDAEMATILAKAPDPAAAVRPLIDLANQKGGPDNVTAVVVQMGRPVTAPAAAAGRSSAPLLVSLAVLAAVMVGAFFLLRPTGGGAATPVAGLPAVVGNATSASASAGGDPTDEPTSTQLPGVAAVPAPTITMTVTLTASVTATTTATASPVPTTPAPLVPPTLIGPGVACGVGNPPYVPPFSWSYSGATPPGSDLRVRIYGGTHGDSGNILTSIPVASGTTWTLQAPSNLFETPGDYRWRVYSLSRPELASGLFCFRVEASQPATTAPPDGGDPVPGATPVTPAPPDPNQDSDGDGVIDSKDECKDEDQGSSPDSTRPGCPEP